MVQSENQKGLLELSSLTLSAFTWWCWEVGRDINLPKGQSLWVCGRGGGAFSCPVLLLVSCTWQLSFIKKCSLVKILFLRWFGVCLEFSQNTITKATSLLPVKSFNCSLLLEQFLPHYTSPLIGQLEDDLASNRLFAIIFLKVILNSVLYVWTHCVLSPSFYVTVQPSRLYWFSNSCL